MPICTPAAPKIIVANICFPVAIPPAAITGTETDLTILGSNVKRGKVTQILKIKNSKIQTDKALNLAVNLDADEINSATSFTQIQGSTLRGNSRKRR